VTEGRGVGGGVRVSRTITATSYTTVTPTTLRYY
jgi:hypothetical protein